MNKVTFVVIAAFLFSICQAEDGWLDLRDCKNATEAVHRLERMEKSGEMNKFTYWCLQDMPVSDRICELAAKHKKLQSLSCAGTKLTDVGIKMLAKHPSLELLWLNNTLVTDKSTPYIITIPKLNSLYLGVSNFSDDNTIEILNRFKLKEFAAPYSMGDNGFESLIERGTELTGLSLYSWKISKDNYVKLCKLPSLQELWIEYSHISDKSVQSLSQLPKLTFLNIQENPDLTDKSLLSFKGHKTLETLAIPYRCTDDILPILQSIKSLRLCHGVEGQFTEKSLADFRKKRPEVELDLKTIAKFFANKKDSVWVAPHYNHTLPGRKSE